MKWFDCKCKAKTTNQTTGVQILVKLFRNCCRTHTPTKDFRLFRPKPESKHIGKRLAWAKMHFIIVLGKCHSQTKKCHKHIANTETLARTNCHLHFKHQTWQISKQSNDLPEEKWALIPVHCVRFRALTSETARPLLLCASSIGHRIIGEISSTSFLPLLCNLENLCHLPKNISLACNTIFRLPGTQIHTAAQIR